MGHQLASVDAAAIRDRAREYLDRIRAAQHDLEQSPSGRTYFAAKKVRDGASTWLRLLYDATRRLELPPDLAGDLRTVEAVAHQLTRAMAAQRDVYRSGIRPDDPAIPFADSAVAPT